MGLGSPSRSPVDWSRKRKAGLILFALIMAYLQSFYILAFYVSDMEYWGTVWIGVTAEQRLLSFLLALLANFGLIAMPLLRSPGRILSGMIALSLAYGMLLSIGWSSYGIGTLSMPVLEPNASRQQVEFWLIGICFFVLYFAVIAFYLGAILLNGWFLVILTRMFLGAQK
jgi:hypothetical protein